MPGLTSGKPAKGTSKQSLQLPDELHHAFRADTRTISFFNPVKYSGTLAISLWMALPKGVRKELYDWFVEQHMSQNQWPTPLDVEAKCRELLESNAPVLGDAS